MTILASKIVHRNQTRIKVEFPYNRECITLLRQVEDAKWSQTHKAWHIPYSKNAFEHLKSLFPTVEIKNIELKKNSTSKRETEKPFHPAENRPKKKNLPTVSSVTIEIIHRKIILKMPKNDTDVKFILTLRYSRWDKHQKVWIIPHYGNNLEVLKAYFKDRISNITIHKEVEIETSSDTTYKLQQKEVLAIQTSKGRIKIIFGFNKEITKSIKKMPFWSWNAKNKWWTVPFSDKIVKQLEEVVGSEGYTLKWTKENEISHKTPRKSEEEVTNYRPCPEKMILKLTELRYSPRTIKTYKSLFEEFINHYPTEDIDTLDEQKIIAFCQYLVIDRKVSVSYQNQAINAIKFYYERVLGGKRKFYFLERPKKEKTLPTVLSEEEVTLLLKTVKNLKHKAILMTIYSAGLRIGELINLKVTDIDSERKQIRIEQSKSKKDRYTLLSNKTLGVLRLYFKEYQPKIYLFEGQGGGKYTSRSVQAFFRDICKKAGIKKRVTVHTLRHSFATHLLENGTDLRYIQNLLGHDSSKTTEIYTHITTKGFKQIKNPLDNLDI